MKPKGSVYILVLTTSLVLVIVTVGLSRFLIRARQDARSARQVEQAQIHAQLGLRHALWATHHNSNWRTLLPNGEWLTDIAVGQATYTVTGTDPDDGNLADNPADAVILQCSAAVGDITRTLQVEARSSKMEFLNYQAAAGGNLYLNGSADIEGDVYINGNLQINGSDCYIDGDAMTAGSVSGYTTHITGVTTTGAADLDLPAGTTAYDYFAPLATTIPYQSEIFAKVLAPNSNPYGATNSDGVYLINCSGQRIVIKQSRIVGTLILVNPADTSAVEISVNWQPARTDYPALIVHGGNFEFKIDSDIYEMLINADLSLPGELGYGTKLSSYDGEIHGLIFTNRSLSLSQNTLLYGQAVALVNLTLNENADIYPDPLEPEPFILPFVTPALTPVRGSYQWITP